MFLDGYRQSAVSAFQQVIRQLPMYKMRGFKFEIYDFEEIINVRDIKNMYSMWVMS